MSSTVYEEIKERIRQRVDLLDVAGQSLELRRQGRDFVAICPWHDDTRPSLRINPQRQSWKCWVCDIGGDVFSFIMRRENVDFREALEMLAERAGLEMPQATPAQRAASSNRRSLLDTMRWACDCYHRCLMESPLAQPARDYLQGRGITLESGRRFGLGFAPAQWQWITDLAQREGYSLSSLETVGLAARKDKGGGYYDLFRGRLLFPIRDVQGRPIALGGRILPQFAEDSAAKYINTRETKLFSKSENLYGLDVVRNANHRTGKILVMEGYTDVVVAHQTGVEDAVAVLGTALGPRHVQLLRRFAEQVVLVLDGDEAGQRRTNEILELFVSEQMDMRVLTLPSGLDPCDFLLEKGMDAFRELENGARPALDHKLETVLAGVDVRRDAHAVHQALEDILRIMAMASRSATLSTTAQRLREEGMLSQLARRFGVEATWIRQRLMDIRSTQSRNRREQSRASGPEATAKPTLRAADRELLQILLQEPRLIDMAAQRIDAGRLADGPARLIYETCLNLAQRQQTLEFGQLMTYLEDPRLKSLLVELDETAARLAESATEDAARRLERLIVKYEHDDLRQTSRRTREELNQVGLDAASEVLKLQELIEHQRTRQGINRPKEG